MWQSISESQPIFSPRFNHKWIVTNIGKSILIQPIEVADYPDDASTACVPGVTNSPVVPMETQAEPSADNGAGTEKKQLSQL